MLARRNSSPCPVEDSNPVKCTQASAVASTKMSHEPEKNIKLDVSDITADNKQSDYVSWCNDSATTSATAEWSMSSGYNFHDVSSRDVSPNRTLNRQRSILRKEPSIPIEPPESMNTRIPKVKFGTVLIREYEIILGDHPCCSYGPPITISWNYCEQYDPCEVDKYEFDNALNRRSMREMMLNYHQRKYLLQDHSEEEFKKVKKEVKRIKSQRDFTKTLARYYPITLPIEAGIESAFRKFKRAVFKK